MKNTRGIVSLAGFVLLAGGVLPSLAVTEISLQSPFVPRAGSGVATVTENSPVELRGILTSDDGTVSFGLYDPVKKQAGWLKLNEVGKDFVATVKNYDANNAAITVEYQGRSLNLVLMSAKIQAAPAVAMVSPRPMAPPPGQPAATPAPSADDTRRLEAVAAEVARRRQARQAAAQQQPQPQPAPVAQPQQNVPNRQR